MQPGGFVYKLRTSGKYRAFFYWLKHWILPTIFAAIIFAVLAVIGFAVVNRILFAAWDLTGNVCKPGQTPVPVTTPVKFETKTLCTATGLQVEKGKSYRVTLVVTDPWEDGHKFEETNPEKARGIVTDPRGFGFEKMRWTMIPGVPIRRLLASNWFATALRIGNTGLGEVVPTWERNDAPACLCPAKVTYTTTFRAKKSGELFVYVNDSVSGWPGYFDYFYTLNNKGAAELTLQPVAK